MLLAVCGLGCDFIPFMGKDYKAYWFCFPTYLENNSMLFVFPNLKIHHIFCPILMSCGRRLNIVTNTTYGAREMVHQSRALPLLQRARVWVLAPMSLSQNRLQLQLLSLPLTLFLASWISHPQGVCVCVLACMHPYAVAEVDVRNFLLLTLSPYSLDQGLSVKPRVC